MFVELVYERGCPNVPAARERLLQAFSRLNITPHWREWDRDDPASPVHARRHGSPTILVDGRDVDGDGNGHHGQSCRLYSGSGSALACVPALARVVAAMQSAHTPGNSPGRRAAKVGGAVVPGIGVVLVPKLVCPFCWPLYTSLLASAGLGFINYTPYLYPVTALFLGVAVIAITANAPGRSRAATALVASAAALAILAGKFHLHSDVLIAAATGVLIVVAVFCMVRHQPRKSASCPRCHAEADGKTVVP